MKSKPAVAFSLQRAAKENIEVKLNWMLVAVGDRPSPDWLCREDLLKCCPSSLRQFNAWKIEGVALLTPSDATFGKNAQRTLNKNAALKLSVQQAILAVRNSRAKRSKKTKIETLADLKRELQEARLLKKIAMRELQAERSTHASDFEEAEKRVKRAESATNEAVRKLNEVRAEQATLASENAKLLAEKQKLESKLKRCLGLEKSNVHKLVQSAGE